MLNPVIKPGFGTLMRTAEATQVPIIIGGFAQMTLVLSVLVALLHAPRHWWWRGVTAGALVSLLLFGATRYAP